MLGPAADTAAQNNPGWLVQNPFVGTGFTPPLLNPTSLSANSPLPKIAATAASSSSSSSRHSGSSNGALHYVTLMFYSEAEGIAGEVAQFAVELLAERRRAMLRPLEQQQQQQQQQQRRHSSDNSSSSSDDSSDDEPSQVRPPQFTDRQLAKLRQQMRNNGALTHHDVIQLLDYTAQAEQRSADLPSSSSSSKRDPDRPLDDESAAAVEASLKIRRLRLLQLLAWWPMLTSAQEMLQQSVWGVIQSRIMLMGPDGETGPPVRSFQGV
jgi:hypothetical protein